MQPTPEQIKSFEASLPELLAGKRESTIVRILDTYPDLLTIRPKGREESTLSKLISFEMMYAVNHCLFRGVLQRAKGGSEVGGRELILCAMANDATRSSLYRTLMAIDDGVYLAAAKEVLTKEAAQLPAMIVSAVTAPTPYSLPRVNNLLDALPDQALSGGAVCNSREFASGLVSAICHAGSQNSDRMEKVIIPQLIRIGCDFNVICEERKLSPLAAACVAAPADGSKSSAILATSLVAAGARLDPKYFNGKSVDDFLADKPVILDAIRHELILANTNTPQPAANATTPKQRTRRAV